jgi:hypothetical protein
VRTVAGQIQCRGRPDGGIATVALPGRAQDFQLNAAGGCATLDGGRLACWQGEGESAFPIDAATGAMAFAKAAPDADRVCVRRAHAAPVCFGATLWHPVPQGAQAVPKAPRVEGIEVLNDFAGVEDLLLVDAGVCGRFADGRVICRPPELAPLWLAGLDLMATHGSVSCGRSSRGELRCLAIGGEAARGTPQSMPTGIPASLTSLALGKWHSCALAKDRVMCWGKAAHGQLGDGTRYLHATPIRLAGIDDAVALLVAETLACAIRRTGTLTCWGSLTGESETGPAFPGFVPVPIPFPGSIEAAYVGSQSDAHRLCAKSRTGWRCYVDGTWRAAAKPPGPEGSFFAQVGVPVRRLAPDGLCAVGRDGDIWCGHCGACRRAEAKARLTRISEGGPFAEVSAVTRDPATGESVVCGRTVAHRIRCFLTSELPFRRDPSPRAIDDPGLAALAEVESIVALGVARAQANLVCARTRSGTVYCWGEGRHGQLGQTGPVSTLAPQLISGLPPVVELGVGGTFACARTASGQIYCWGSNREGTVPDGAPEERKTAVEVE